MVGSLLESGNITLILFNNFKEPGGSDKEKVSTNIILNATGLSMQQINNIKL